MVQNPVSVDFQATGGGASQETFNDGLLVARDSTAPPQGFNVPKDYQSPVEVANDIGDGSKAHTASQMLDSHGVEEWTLVVLEEQNVSNEVVGSSDTSSTTTGTVANTPIAGHRVPTISVDGTTQTVTATTDTAAASPSSGEAVYNPETGQVKTGSASSGAGAGIEVSYDYLSWSSAFANLDGTTIDCAALADVRVSIEYLGDLDELIQWGSGESIMTYFAPESGSTFATDDAALAANQEVSSYVSSGFATGYAHKSSDDVASDVMGLDLVQKSWKTVRMKSDLKGNYADFYRETLIGEPGDYGTFEGGMAEAGSEGAGPLNVIRNYGGSTVASNDLTTAGETSKFEHARAGRVRKFTVTKVTEAMIGLTKDNEIAFDDGAQQQIEDALVGALQPFDFSGGPYQSLDIDVPRHTEVPDSYRTDDKYGPIQITYQQTRLAEQFQVNILAQTA